MSSEEYIGRYVIKDVLGEGAMGRVYACYDPNLERPVAIKTMRTGNLQKEDLDEFKKRFAQESKVSGRLIHPNIVSIYDSGMHGKEPFLVMEFIDGTPLDTFARNQFRSVLEQYAHVMEQAASGLDFAHEEEVIHRDIKPGNILITRSRSGKLRPKILDFGLARLQDSKITQTGFFLGTPSYASPEQVITGKVDYRSDIFSFGTVAYEMLTGRLPFEAESLHAILYQIANETPKIDFTLLDGLLDTDALAAVFQKNFSKKADDRYQTAVSFVQALKPILAELPRLAPEICRRRDEAAKAEVAESQPLDMNGSIEDSLETALIDSAALAPPPPEVDSELSEKAKLIKQARAQFREAYKTCNLSSIRFCLRELINLGAETSEEEALIRQLEQRLEEEERVRREKEKDRLISEARNAFRLALETRNLESCGYCLQELQSLGAGIRAESDELAALKETIREAEERARKETRLREQFREMLRARKIVGCEKFLRELSALGVDVQWEKRAVKSLHQRKKKDELQRESWIRKVRVQFREAVQKKNATRCRQLITELESLLKVDASNEKNAFADLEQQIQDEEARELNQQIEENLRFRFQQELAHRAVRGCRDLISQLEELGVDASIEKQALGELKRQISEEEARKLKESIILHTREKLHDAINNRNAKTARYYLEELQQLVDETDDEKKRVAQLEARILKENIIDRQRASFGEAVKAGNVEKARYYLGELRLNGARIDEEQVTLQGLTQRSQAERELQENMVAHTRRDFREALKKRDISACEHALHLLDEMHVDSVEETRELADMRMASLKLSKIGGEHRKKLIKRFRHEFAEALKVDQLDTCRHHLDNLMALQADTGSEEQSIEALAARLQEAVD